MAYFASVAADPRLHLLSLSVSLEPVFLSLIPSLYETVRFVLETERIEDCLDVRNVEFIENKYEVW